MLREWAEGGIRCGLTVGTLISDRSIPCYCKDDSWFMRW